MKDLNIISFNFGPIEYYFIKSYTFDCTCKYEQMLILQELAITFELTADFSMPT